MFGAISEKFRTFDMQINFAIPPISHFRRWLGEFFSLFQSYEISITLSINLLRNYWAFPDSPYLISNINHTFRLTHICHTAPTISISSPTNMIQSYLSHVAFVF